MTLTRAETIELAVKLLPRLTVYGSKVAVIRDEDEGVGGIIAPDGSDQKPLRGRVIMTGLAIDTEDRDDQLFGLRIGDAVYFTKYNPVLFTVEIDGVKIDYEVMHASDIHLGLRD